MRASPLALSHFSESSERADDGLDGDDDRRCNVIHVLANLRGRRRTDLQRGRGRGRRFQEEAKAEEKTGRELDLAQEGDGREFRGLNVVECVLRGRAEVIGRR
jgi:hypothetical protein